VRDRYRPPAAVLNFSNICAAVADSDASRTAAARLMTLRSIFTLGMRFEADPDDLLVQGEGLPRAK
jgi:hypothetical protein